MKESRYDKDEGISRGDFLKKGLLALGCLAVLGVAGCREQGMAPRPNVPIAQALNFTGDPATKVYHKINCKLAPEKNKGVYFDSPVAAQNSGFRPCLVCKPMQP